MNKELQSKLEHHTITTQTKENQHCCLYRVKLSTTVSTEYSVGRKQPWPPRAWQCLVTSLTAANLLPRTSRTLRIEPVASCRTMETVRNIHNPIPPVVLQPSKWLSLYEDFVAKNSSSVGSVESALRSLTYIIPGKIHFGLSSSGRLLTCLSSSCRKISRIRNPFRMW